MALLTIQNLLAWTVQVGVISVVAAGAFRLLRVRAPGVRHASWRALLVLGVVLPVLQPWHVTTAIIDGSSAALDLSPLSISSGPVAEPTLADTLRGNSLILALAAGCGARLLWIGLGIARLRRLRRRRTLAAPECIVSAEVQQALGTHARVQYADDLEQPATFGIFRPVVLLPRRVKDMDPSVERAVVVHELLHVRRRDWAWMVAEELVRAALWFNPAIWWLVDRVQATREEVVDQAAMRLSGGRRPYVRALLEFADTTTVPAAPAFAERRHLFARITILCEESNMSIKRVVAALALVAFAAGAMGVAGVAAFPINGGEEVIIAPAVQDPAPPPPPPPPPPPAPPTAKGTRKSAHPRDLPPPPPPPPAPLTVQGEQVKVVQTPLLIRDVRPRYPADAMKAGIEGIVEVEIVIENDGAVKSARVVRSIPALDAAAIDAVKQWRFKPFSGNAVTRTAELSFTLKDNQERLDVSHAGDQMPLAAAGSSNDGAPQPVRVGGNIRTPTKTHHANPVYPPDAQAARVAGMVILEVRIGTDGSVEDARVLRSIPILDEAALEAVRQWRFTPTLLNGQPVPVIMTVTVNFTLEGAPSSPSALRALPRTVTLRANDASVQQVLQMLASHLQVRLRIEGTLTAKTISIDFNAASAGSVLDAVCGHARCTWRFDSVRQELTVSPTLSP